MNINDKIIVWFADVANHDVASVGNKGVNLSVLNCLHLPVPSGFCLTTAAYKLFCKELGFSYNKHLSPQEMFEEGYKIRRKLFNAPLSGTIAMKLREYYKELIKHERFPVIVRPSPVDLNIHSRPYNGLLEPVANINGIIDLEKAVKVVWASAFSDRAIEYRIQKQLQFTFDDMALVIQIMFEPEKGGTAFSFNPLNNKDEEMLIESTYGVGQIIVAGPIIPDRFIWHRFSKELLSSQVGDKKYEEFFLEHRTIFAQSKRKENLLSLQSEEISQLARIIEKVVSHYAFPCALEWFMKNGKFYIWQSYLIPKYEQKIELKCTEDACLYPLNDYFPGYISPLAYNLFTPIIEKAFIKLCQEFDLHMEPGQNLVTLINNQLYINEKNLQKLELQLPNLNTLFDSKLNINKILNFIGILYTILKFLAKWYLILYKYKRAIHKLWLFKYSLAEKEDLFVHMIKIKNTGLELFEYLVALKFIRKGMYKLIFDYLVNLLTKPVTLTCMQVLTTHLSAKLENASTIFNNLIKQVKIKDELRKIFFSYPVDKIIDKLNENEIGQHFLEEMKDFLSGFGYYKEKILDPALSNYIESPARILDEIIAEITANNDETNIDETQEKKLCMDTVIQKLKFPVTFIFKLLLKILQSITIIEEEEVFYFTIYTPLLRRTLLELGSKLSLKDRTDIFFLLNNEIQETLTNPSFPLTALSNRIEQRKAEIKSVHQVVEEPIQTEEVESDKEGFVLSGIPVSKGKYQGRIKIIRNMDSFPDIKGGEILIAPYIDSSWQFLIKKAGAIVTEFGGILSSGAILAREYKIPAVAGVRNVFMSFIDNQSVEVNGNTGKIRRL